MKDNGQPPHPIPLPQGGEGVEFLDQIPEPYQVFGLTLLPLSIGRYRRLARHGVAFVSAKAVKAEVGDLLLGVIICSMSCAAFDRLATERSFKDEIRHWARRVLPQPWPNWFIRYLPNFYFLTVVFWEGIGLGRRWRAKHCPDLGAKFTLFMRYIAEAQKCPPVRCKEAAARILQTHWVDSLELVLREKLNWSNEEIEEQPLGKALTHYFNWADANGLIISDEDISIAEANTAKIVEALEKFRKKQEGGKSGGNLLTPALPPVGDMDENQLHPLDVLGHLAAQKGAVA